MRQLIVRVARGDGEAVLEAARSLRGSNLFRHDATAAGEPAEVVFVHIPNDAVDELFERLTTLPGVEITLVPRGVIALQAPFSRPSDRTSDVRPRSPSEVYLGGLQSVGSWAGFLGYAAAAGAVAWVGLFTNTGYLLTAAMLIAPFAGPAMNAALATACGDPSLLGRSLLRYAAALGVAILEAALLSSIAGQAVATSSMVATSQVSSVAFLLPLLAGAAGALNLVQSERSSLVSGAAVGMLVAASLAPPAGLVGMAGAMGRWDLAGGGAFLLLLQLAGINLSGSLVFRACGLSPTTSKGGRGRVLAASLVASSLALAGLLVWQFRDAPGLQRSSMARRAKGVVEDAVRRSPLAELVEADVRFTRPDLPGPDTLLSIVYVRPREGVDSSPREIKSAITRSIRDRLLGQGYDVRPLIDLTVLDAPAVAD